MIALMDAECLANRARFLWRIFALALAIRLLAIVVLHAYPCPQVVHQDDPEAEHFARTLVAEGRWTNPYLPEGRLPSALRAPVHSFGY